MSESLHRESVALTAPDTGRIVRVQLVTYGEARDVQDPGGVRYREQFESLALAPKIRVKDSHGGAMIGHADLDSYGEDPNPSIDLHIADTQAGTDALALIRNGSIDGVSIEFVPDPADTEHDGVMVRSNALVHGIALAFRPAHSAPVLSVRETPDPTTPEETTMNTDTDTPVLTREDLDTFGDELRRDVLEDVRTATTVAAVDDPYSLYRQFETFGEFYTAALDDPSMDGRILNRALVDQITTDNPGVVPPAWVTDIKGIIERSRVTIDSFGVTSLPASGMSVDWPYYDGDVTALVGAQATEKTEATSVLVSLKRGTEDIASYAGASDISQQLLRRSSPSYLEAYLRIMAIGYGATTDAAAIAQAITAGSDCTVAWDPATGTADGFREALFVASVEVETATGAPASFAVVATDIFTTLGGLLTPAAYGTQNLPGVADASTLRINVSGLEVRHDIYAPAGTVLVSNMAAGAWHEDGPMTLQAPDVAKIGQDVAVWGMGIFTPYLPTGIRQIKATVG